MDYDLTRAILPERIKVYKGQCSSSGKASSKAASLRSLDKILDEREAQLRQMLSTSIPDDLFGSRAASSHATAAITSQKVPSQQHSSNSSSSSSSSSSSYGASVETCKNCDGSGRGGSVGLAAPLAVPVVKRDPATEELIALNYCGGGAGAGAGAGGESGGALREEKGSNRWPWSSSSSSADVASSGLGTSPLKELDSEFGVSTAFGWRRQKVGLKITHVEPDGRAAKAGVRVGWIIVAVNGGDTRNDEHEYRRLLADAVAASGKANINNNKKTAAITVAPRGGVDVVAELPSPCSAPPIYFHFSKQWVEGGAWNAELAVIRAAEFAEAATAEAEAAAAKAAKAAKSAKATAQKNATDSAPPAAAPTPTAPPTPPSVLGDVYWDYAPAEDVYRDKRGLEALRAFMNRVNDAVNAFTDEVERGRAAGDATEKELPPFLQHLMTEATLFKEGKLVLVNGKRVEVGDDGTIVVAGRRLQVSPLADFKIAPDGAVEKPSDRGVQQQEQQQYQQQAGGRRKRGAASSSSSSSSPLSKSSLKADIRRKTAEKAELEAEIQRKTTTAKIERDVQRAAASLGLKTLGKVAVEVNAPGSSSSSSSSSSSLVVEQEEEDQEDLRAPPPMMEGRAHDVAAAAAAAGPSGGPLSRVYGRGRGGRAGAEDVPPGMWFIDVEGDGRRRIVRAVARRTTSTIKSSTGRRKSVEDEDSDEDFEDSYGYDLLRDDGRRLVLPGDAPAELVADRLFWRRMAERYTAVHAAAARLRCMYRRVNPVKLASGEVDQWLLLFLGREDELLRRVAKRYNLQDDDDGSGGGGSGSGSSGAVEGVPSLESCAASGELDYDEAALEHERVKWSNGDVYEGTWKIMPLSKRKPRGGLANHPPKKEKAPLLPSSSSSSPSSKKKGPLVEFELNPDGSPILQRKMHGAGIFKYASGDYYQGEFRNGMRHGYGGCDFLRVYLFFFVGVRVYI
jgi:hypothetical protein